MYKTVRHGDNSLQYKILAQQEEGTTTVKCRKSRRRRAAGIFTIVILLVCGVITFAVLVPLILTNDFINLTGAFQKYSVSTLRRTHSGNHVVVIAKKPHGWSASSQNLVQPTFKPKNETKNQTKEEPAVKEPPQNNLPFPSTNKNATKNESSVTENHYPRFETVTVKLVLPTLPTSNEINGTTLWRKQGILSVTSTSDIHPKIELEWTINVTSTSMPKVWYRPGRWNFRFLDSFVRWLKNKITNHPLQTAAAGFFIFSFILLIVFLSRKISPKNNGIQEGPCSLKEDKTRLLKASSRGSDEE